MKCSNCGFHLKDIVNICPNCGNSIIDYIDVNTINNKNKYKLYSILSLFLSLIPIALILYCYIYSGGDLSENGNGVVFWYVMIYFGTIGLPLAFLSIFLGIKSFKTKKTLLSALGIIIGALPFLVIIIYYIILVFTNIYYYISIFFSMLK